MHWWLTPIILATHKAEIWRRQTICKNLSQKPNTKKTGLAEWLKWYSMSLESVRPCVLAPVLPKTKQIKTITTKSYSNQDNVLLVKE
jgi:hypothetical protein